MTKSQLRDYQLYYKINPETGFSPARNKQIIAETIKEADENRVRKMQSYMKNISNRINMLFDYWYSPKSTSMEMEKYFGKKWMGYLRGQELVGEFSGYRRKYFT